jgi:hypothetical protein
LDFLLATDLINHKLYPVSLSMIRFALYDKIGYLHPEIASYSAGKVPIYLGDFLHTNYTLHVL